MTDEKRMYVHDQIRQFFWRVAEVIDATILTNRIVEDVIKDIDETADEEFNSSDVDIAITRVLLNRL